MEENNNMTEKIEEEQSHRSSHHGSHYSSHHGSHHSSHYRSHSGSGESKRRKSYDSQRKVVKRTYRKVKFQKFYKPLLGIGLFLAMIILFSVLIWAAFNPSPEVREAVERNKNVTENVSSEVRIKELEAEIDALNEEIDEYKSRISELEGKLAAEAVDSEQ